jgi:hypothetical protein
MKLPGKMLMPCKIHMIPAKISTTPTRLQKIRMIILPFIPIKGWFCWKIIHQSWCNPSIDSIRQIHCLRLVVVALYGNLEVFCTHPPLRGVLLYPTKAGLALALIIPAVRTTPPQPTKSACADSVKGKPTKVAFVICKDATLVAENR